VDTRGDAEAVSPEAVRLTRINRVAALLGGTDSSQAAQVARTAQAYSMPAIVSSAPPGQQLEDFVFCISLSPAARGRALARLAIQELKTIPTVVLTDDRGPTGVELAAAFASEYARHQGTRPDELAYRNEAAFPELAGRLQKRKSTPKALLIAGTARDFGKLRAQVEKTGLRPVWLFGSDEAATTALLADREAGQGVYLATAYVMGQGGPRDQEFAHKYQELFHAAPTVHAALAYDSVRLLCGAAQHLIPFDPDKVRAHLNGMTAYDSLTGPLAFGKDHYARRAMFVVRLDEGRMKLVLRIEPET
jgi:ABC-type branched-subunit amino acid transport system substrate-binding protein